MAYEAWIHKLSFNLSRGIGWRMAAPWTFGLFLIAGLQGSRASAISQFVSAFTLQGEWR
jgi:hypothetical protein